MELIQGFELAKEYGVRQVQIDFISTLKTLTKFLSILKKPYFDSDPSEISDLVEKTAIFGEVDAKESVLEDQRSGEDQTQQAPPQKETVQKDTVSRSSNLDLNKSLSDFVLAKSATLTPKQSEKHITLSPILNLIHFLFNPRESPCIRGTARKTIRPQTPRPSPLRKAIKTWSYSSLESSPQSKPHVVSNS